VIVFVIVAVVLGWFLLLGIFEFLAWIERVLARRERPNVSQTNVLIDNRELSPWQPVPRDQQIAEANQQCKENRELIELCDELDETEKDFAEEAQKEKLAHRIEEILE